MTPRRWVLRGSDVEARERISRASPVSGLVAAVLAARGVSDPDDVDAFLNPSLAALPDPSLIHGMDAAVDRLSRAFSAREPVWVYTDYDVDGVTSAALLDEFFRACGFPVHVRLPHREREGYGLSPDAVREIAGRGGRVVVTADCGIGAVDAARSARELGVDLVITDHHTPGPEVPRAAAVVNPKLPDSAYPDAAIAGVGVAWNLAVALRRRWRETGGFQSRPEPDLRDLLDLVALGTVADVVPLRGVNRALVSAGLRQLNRKPRPGVAALREVAGVRGALRAGHIGFQLGPRLNAAGRLEGPQEALALLSAADLSTARPLAARLDELNRRRQAEERSILDEASARVERERWWPERWSLVVESAGWHAGVVGIVASRLAERYTRPTVVLAVDGASAKGSARSVPGLHLHEALSDCSDLLDRFGGHAAAAGLGLPAAAVGAFRERFEAAVRSRLTPEALVPVLTLDAVVSFDELTETAVADLETLEPFGAGNPSPGFVSRGVRVLDVRPLGREGEHLKFRLGQGQARVEAVAWRRAAVLRHVRPGDVVDVAYTPQIRRWGGSESVQLQVEEMRPA